MNIQSWKELATSQLNALRILFLMTVSWDFFLTIISKASQRALLLTGVGAQYTPIVVIPWAACILLLAILLYFQLKKDDQSVVTQYGYYVYFAFIGLYVILSCIALINPLISWPLMLNYIVNILWASTIVYFRFKVNQTANMGE